MPVLGLITCEVLEEEWAGLLADDPDIDRIVVLEDVHSWQFIHALETRGCTKIVRIPHLKAFMAEPSSGIVIIVRVLEFGLHRSRNVLRRALAGTVREMSRHADAIILGYGLCGNALDHPKEIMDVKIPVFIPMDGNHPVDDCVGMLFGGRTRYHEEQCRVPGTFFMTPGWTRHWRRLLDKDATQTSASLHTSLKRVFDRYKRCLLVVTPVMSEEEMRTACQPFADLIGLRTESCCGSLDILEKTWQSAKEFTRERDKPKE